jgi:hypothetical protein
MRAQLGDRQDFLDEIIDERGRRNPEFLDLVQAALDRRMARPERAVTAPERAADAADLDEIGD